LVYYTVSGKTTLSLKKVVSNYTINTNQIISSEKPIIFKNMDVVQPADLTVESSEYIEIKPETVIKKGSEAVFELK